MARPRKKAPFVKNYAPDLQDELAKRVTECKEVLSHLKECPAWKIIIQDLERSEKQVDNKWHTTMDDKILQEFRVTKFAIMHLKNIEGQYEMDLENAQQELNKLQNTDKEMVKDYDVETTTESM